MKTRVIPKSYEEVLALPAEERKKPLRPHMFFRCLIRLLSAPDMLAVQFSHQEKGMEKLGEDEPALFLMNHSSFIDLKIAYAALSPAASTWSAPATPTSARVGSCGSSAASPQKSSSATRGWCGT